MEEEQTVITSYIATSRDALIVAGDLRPLHRDLDLHILSLDSRPDGLILSLLRDGLAALALYMCSRPKFESLGWTINLQRPLLNLFFTGSPRDGTVVGRAFTRDVERAESGRFFVQAKRPFGEPQTSAVPAEGVDIYSMVERLCAQSDQLPGRFFHDGDERGAFVTLFPDGDTQWLGELGPAEVFGLLGRPDVRPATRHPITFRCGCDTGRLTRFLLELYGGDTTDLFRGDAEVEVECNRCGARYTLSAVDFERESGGRGTGI